MAMNSLYYADVPLSNYSLTPPSRHRIAVLFDGEFVPTMTAAATLPVMAALSKAAC